MATKHSIGESKSLANMAPVVSLQGKIDRYNEHRQQEMNFMKDSI